ncbi:PqqD family protein [Jiangella asiatica]|uniref:PqqD family protein n=1 Tax=Jiangella asiatica TaxID=2530372 RepID=A0A4R5CIL3_9ACTN|nr:PqqD family protein [Jiangella asiatica]TDD98949.1 PqqD family protein [Jiangella asiatica]
MSSSPAFAPAAAIRELDVDGEVTLYHEPTRTALVLNQTASDVWRLLDGQRTVAEIVELLARAYDTDADTVRSGVHTALEQLAAHRVLDGHARP